MYTQNKKSTIPDEHIETLKELLAQLKTHLTKTAAEKGTYTDYLRLLEFYSQTNAVQPRKLIVGWVNDLNAYVDKEEELLEEPQ